MQIVKSLAVAFAGTLLASTAARADAPEASCEAGRVMQMSDADIETAGRLARYHPRAMIARVAPLLGRGAYAEALAAVVVDARAALVAGAIPIADADRYRSRLRTSDSAFAIAATLPRSAQARYVADVVKPADFFLSQDANGNYPIFAGTDFQIVVTAAMTTEQQRALCWPTLAVERLLTLFGETNRAASVDALETLAMRWEKYVENSYSQLPWELALNGLIRGRSGYEPPKSQLVLLHPSVGVEANGSVLKELRRVDVAVLEPIGYLRYNGDYTRYFGVSSALTFASNRNVAIGGYVHLWFPQAKIGYVVRSEQDRRRRSSALVSMDLYDFLSGVPDQLRSARESAFARRVLELTNATGR
jgi:hypothetical protein